MNIANEAISNDIESAVGIVLSGAKNIQGLAKLSSRKSIMTMAAPGMYQYPLIASNGIETEYLMAIAKAYQLTFAANVATAYSLNPIMDRGKTPQLSDFVQTFHQNNPNLLAGNIDGAATALGISLNSFLDVPEDVELAVESATVGSISKEDAVAMNLAAWDNVEDSLVMESLNDMYKPYERTERILKEKIAMIRETKERQKATEGLSDFNRKVAGAINQADTAMHGSATSRLTSHGINPGTTTSSSKTYDPRTGKLKGETEKVDKKSPIISNFKNEVVRNNQLESMEPTMVNVQIVAFGGERGDGKGGQSVHNLTLGVKAMPRIIGSNLMIASMVEAVQDSHAIFKFLKWTKGEQSTLDFVLGISASKKKALQKNAKNEVKYLEQGKKRRKINGIGKFLNNEVLPTVSVVITSYEASKIKEVCGVDLNDLKEAIKLMNRYYLLSFGIYDTEQNTMKVLFDCDTDWGYTTIGSLKANINKTNDVLNQNEVLRLFGRR